MSIRALALFLLLAMGISQALSTITVPWYVMTEELPYAQEVLRFLSGDFRQRFFDIPGTPFIALTASSSALILSGIKVVSDRSSSLFEIALNHLNFLYILMRGLSLLAFGVTGWLVFLIARRFASAWAAILGAAVFALHPIMGLSLYHTRIEAFGTMLTAAAVLSLCRATETEQWRWFSAAGFIAGAAMAARFPLALAAFPPLLFYTLARPTKLRGRGTDIDLILVAAFLLIVLLGMALSLFRLFGWFDRSWLTDLFFVSVAHGGHKLATGAIGKLWTVAGAASLGIVAALLSPLRKLLTERYARTSLLTVSVFFPIGVFVGVPTIFAGHDYLLGSIQMFIERNAFIPPASESGILPTLGLYVFGRDPANQLFDVRPFLLHSHYLFAEPGVLFNVALAGLFCAGLVRRPPKTWLYLSILFGCAVGVLSQFGKLQTTRHIAGWLPFFCVVIAVGADFVHEKLLRSRAISATLGLTFVLILYWQDHVIVGVTVRQYLASATLQRELDTWLRSNVPASDVVYHACCEVTSDVALSWMLSNGVDIPPQRIRSGSQIWFGQSSTLRAAQDGYVVTSRLMYPSYYLAYYAQMNPAEAVDPYHDPHFSLRHVIGNTSNPAANKYDVFHFSYLDRPRPPEGGISVEQATYGRSCVSAVPRSYRLSNGNATAAIARMCNRWEQCDLSLSASLLGDPAPFCAKNFDIDWVCPSGQKGHIALSAEAIGKTLHLSCLPSD